MPWAPGRGGEVLYNDSGHRARLLASNSKLFATAAFLNRFGPTGTLETGVWERGQRGGGRDQILRGGLVLVGDGDPALASSRFARQHNLPVTRLKPLAEHVRRAGIRRVRGNLMVDPTIFDGKRSVPQPGITGGPWLSTLSGLSYNSGFDGGHYADSPERIAGRQFVQALRRAGVKVEGRVRVGGAPPKVFDERAIDRVRSPIAAKLIKQTNTPSDNFFAEMLLKRLAAREGHQGTTARGAAKAEDFARSVGSGAHLVNGSGLSRTNTSAPSQVGKLLVHMANDNDLDQRVPQVAGGRGPDRNALRPHARHGRRGPLQRQDRNDRRRQRPLRLLQVEERPGRLLDPDEQHQHDDRPQRPGRDGGRDRAVQALEERGRQPGGGNAGFV